jgi:hypothetical protein
MPFCPNCGKEVASGVLYCPSCGHSMQPAPSPPSVPQPSGYQGIVRPQRPLGVSIIAVLVAIGGIFFVLGGIGLLVFAGFLTNMAMTGGIPSNLPVTTGFVFAASGAIAALLIIFGLIYILLSWGFWSGKGWAWTVGVIFLILGVILDLVSLSVAGVLGIGSLVGLLINVLILYYLFRPHVKAYFGKGSVVL